MTAPDSPLAVVRRFLATLIQPGCVFEVRALECRDHPASTYTYTKSGYYRHEDIETAATDIAALDASGCVGVVYVVMNPVKPELLARAMNHLVRSRVTTTDSAIVARYWLLLDFDPEREAGIPSTDVELSLARAKANVVKAHLAALGWPDPVEVMSGNGVHLLYRIDLPADDGGLVERVLKALAAKFNGNGVKIDTAVGNAARITKVAGTMAANKGDGLVGVPGLADRPRRRAALERVPADLRPVPRELLERVASDVPVTPAAAQPVTRAAVSAGKRFETFDHTPDGVRGYLVRRGVAVRSDSQKEGVTYLHLDQCPVKPECASTGATDISVRVHPDGSISYCNLHDRGKGLTWLDLREALEPGYRAIAEGGAPPLRGQNAIPAPLESKGARIEFAPIRISALGPAEPPDWVWAGYLPRGHVTLLTALWKAGKSTLIAHFLADLGVGARLAAGGKRVGVLVISEESPTLWARRREDLGIGDHVSLVCQPFLGRPDHAKWQAFLAAAVAWCREHDIGLVVFDTIASLWPVTNENDAAEVMAAVMPMRGLTQAGLAVLVVHHPRKGDATEGQASRGSGALPGFVDVILELRRYAAEDRDDRRRVLTAYSRFDETPGEVVLELTDDGYKELGGKADVKAGDRVGVIVSALPTEPPGLTPEEVHKAWPSEPKPGVRTLINDLKSGHKTGRWARTGAGAKGNPYRFWREQKCDSRRTTSIGAGIESEAVAGSPRPPREVAPAPVADPQPDAEEPPWVTDEPEPQSPPAVWSEDAEYQFLERMGVAEDLGLDTSPGSPAELVAWAEADAVNRLPPGAWPGTRGASVVAYATAVFGRPPSRNPRHPALHCANAEPVMVGDESTSSSKEVT